MSDAPASDAAASGPPADDVHARLAARQGRLARHGPAHQRRQGGGARSHRAGAAGCRGRDHPRERGGHRTRPCRRHRRIADRSPPAGSEARLGTRRCRPADRRPPRPRRSGHRRSPDAERRRARAGARAVRRGRRDLRGATQRHGRHRRARPALRQRRGAARRQRREGVEQRARARHARRPAHGRGDPRGDPVRRRLRSRRRSGPDAGPRPGRRARTARERRRSSRRWSPSPACRSSRRARATCTSCSTSRPRWTGRATSW